MELNKLKKKETQQELRVHRETKKVSQNKQALMIGVSAATLSNIENGKFDLLNDSTWYKIISFLSAPDWTLVKTHNHNIIQKMCLDAQYNHKLVSVIGYPGAGKTTSLDDYYRKNEKVYFIRAKVGTNPKLFFNGLLKQMGIMYLATIDEMIERIADELNKQADSLIIIDEAGKLSCRVLMHIHDLRDATQSTTGIILGGVNYFKSNLEKLADKGKQGMPEIYSRIMLWQELRNPLREEKKAICEANGLIDEKSIQIACQSKNYRQLTNQIINAKVIINQNKN